MHLLLLLLVLGSLVPACGRPPPATAAQTLLHYAQALEGDDPQGVYRLLDEPTRAQIPYEEFAQRWRDTAQERQAQARAIRRSLRALPPPLAHVTLADGMRLSLERAPHGGQWLVRDVRWQGARADTPEEALRLLLEAAERRSYAAVLQLLTSAQRQLVEAEVRERVDRLRAALSRRQPIEIRGERARLQYDPRFYIELRKEPEGWRVHDLN
ncbi:MAG: hypothetical protein RMK29_00015 [Myxococcales bacterium]|nr:hypothetical protein [Myxococcota bacterium]MDW8280059.1 hypothetical protein [Myxococcales bacterium]